MMPEVCLAFSNAATWSLVIRCQAFVFLSKPKALAPHASASGKRKPGTRILLTLLVPDILQTGPISVILGPPVDQVTPAMRVIDLFRLPQFRWLPRKPVGGEGSVVFALPRMPAIS